jgi:hypothetical protein
MIRPDDRRTGGQEEIKPRHIAEAVGYALS